MKKVILIAFCGFGTLKLCAQQLDTIYFNLYTDSLKRGTYNYINVEGRFSDGRYLPLGEKEIQLSASAGRFSGNSLFIDSSINVDKVKIKATVNGRPAMSKEIVMYIKKYESKEPLPTLDEILNQPSDQSNKPRTRRKA
jgi:hypothetical protein